MNYIITSKTNEGIILRLWIRTHCVDPISFELKMPSHKYFDGWPFPITKQGVI